MNVVITKLKEIWLVLRRGGFFCGGGCLQFGRGELGWGRRRRRRNSGGRQLAELWYINICRWNHRRTHSVGGSVGNSNGELVMSLYRDLGESLGDSIGKIARKNFHISEPPFLKKIYKYYVCNFVGIYRLYYSADTYLPNYRRNSIQQYISPQYTDRIIPLVLGEFLVVIWEWMKYFL